MWCQPQQRRGFHPEINLKKKSKLAILNTETQDTILVSICAILSRFQDRMPSVTGSGYMTPLNSTRIWSAFSVIDVPQRRLSCSLNRFHETKKSLELTIITIPYNVRNVLPRTWSPENSERKTRIPKMAGHQKLLPSLQVRADASATDSPK